MNDYSDIITIDDLDAARERVVLGTTAKGETVTAALALIMGERARNFRELIDVNEAGDRWRITPEWPSGLPHTMERPWFPTALAALAWYYDVRRDFIDWHVNEYRRMNPPRDRVFKCSHGCGRKVAGKRVCDRCERAQNRSDAKLTARLVAEAEAEIRRRGAEKHLCVEVDDQEVKIVPRCAPMAAAMRSENPPTS